MPFNIQTSQEISRRKYSGAGIFLLLFLLLQLASLFAVAQNNTITGRVQDSKTKEGIAYATIAVKGTNTGIIADSAGDFSLSLNSATQRRRCP